MDSSTEYLTHDISIKKYLYFGVKRLFDILIALIGCLFLLPIILIVKISYLLHKDFDSIFFRQKRIGKNGKEFNLYKFRSMVIGADGILQEYLEKHPKEAKEYDKNKKLKNDPRITKTGKILRKTSLDEWPQFLSILTSDMSLVGPRPYLPREKEDMGEYYDYIIKVKPGLTGPWQVAGRSNLTFEDRLKLDEEYASRCGNKRDIGILFKTIKKVMKKEGAI